MWTPPCSGSDDSSAQTTGQALPLPALLGEESSCDGGATPGLGAAAGVQQAPPPWISTCLASTFFGPCEAHRHLKKNECTYFCTTCAGHTSGLCQHCLCHHQNHKVIQVRRYVYCDVVRAVDINPFVDVTGIQAYIINQAKVVFLNARPQAKFGAMGDADCCRNCSRHLREGFVYCCLACKVQAIENGNDVSASCAPSSPSSADAAYSVVSAHATAPEATPRSACKHAHGCGPEQGAELGACLHLPRLGSGSSDSYALAAGEVAATARMGAMGAGAARPSSKAAAAQQGGAKRKAPETAKKQQQQQVHRQVSGADDSSSCEPEEDTFLLPPASNHMASGRRRVARGAPRTTYRQTAHATWSGEEEEEEEEEEEHAALHPAQLAASKRRRSSSSHGGSHPAKAASHKAFASASVVPLWQQQPLPRRRPEASSASPSSSSGGSGGGSFPAASRGNGSSFPAASRANGSSFQAAPRPSCAPLIQLFMAAGASAAHAHASAHKHVHTHATAASLMAYDGAPLFACAPVPAQIQRAGSGSLPGGSRRKQGAPQRSRDC